MQKQPLNRNWQFALGSTNTMTLPSAWQTVSLPHDWSIATERKADNPSGNSGGYFANGRGWYQQTITPPADWAGKTVLVEFEGAYMNAEVWLNENLLGRHPYGYTSFTVDLTGLLKFGQENTLKVLVDNQAQMNSRWYSGSGLYRPVWLWVGAPLHIGHWGVGVSTPNVTEGSAVVVATTELWNRSGAEAAVTLRSTVFAPDGTQAGQTESGLTLAAQGPADVKQELTLTNPALWSPESPALYRLVSELLQDGVVVDQLETTFGVRILQMDAEHGLSLNGKPILLKGGCVHHDHGVIGSAAFAAAEARKVQIHKDSGYNTIRTAHNPPSPAFLDACDRLGMLVMDEAFDCWREGKNPHDYHISFDDWWQRDIESMVLRDRNHPCIIFWSIGNEVMERDGRSGGAEIARMLADEVRRLDPTRPITSAICSVWDKTHVWEDTDPVFAVLDAGGYNYQWKLYESDHARLPQRLMMGTESFPLEAFDNWMQVVDHPYVLGDFVWTSLDYLGEAGIGRVHFGESEFLGVYPWHQAFCGDLDLCGFKRPQSYYRDMLWNVGEPLYIAVHAPVPAGKTPIITAWGWPDVAARWNWDGHEGENFIVDVYSRCDQVELWLNGRSLGVKPTTRAERFCATFEVPYEIGELKAVGTCGDTTSEYVLATTGSPAEIRLTADRSALKQGEGDLAYVTVEAVDSQGRRVPYAANMMLFSVEGAGKLLAVGSGNPKSDEAYVGNQRKVFEGVCLAVLRAGDSVGRLTLHVMSEGLPPAALTVSVG